jgi:hypothetical protein
MTSLPSTGLPTRKTRAGSPEQGSSATSLWGAVSSKTTSSVGRVFIDVVLPEEYAETLNWKKRIAPGRVIVLVAERRRIGLGAEAPVPESCIQTICVDRGKTN